MTDTILKRHLDLWASTQFVWGPHDCGHAIADYLVELGFHDPAKDIRGHYRTVLGCYRFVKKHYGSVLEMCHLEFGRIGLVSTEGPKVGDVGVVRVASGQLIAVKSMDPNMWSSRTLSGVGMFRTDRPLAAWSVTCHQ